LDPSRGIVDDFGDFKGNHAEWNEEELGWKITRIAERETATIKQLDSDVMLQFEFKTGDESMPPIWAGRYWNIKHPFLDKLMTSMERKQFAERRKSEKAD
jgi:hypothetical protein